MQVWMASTSMRWSLLLSSTPQRLVFTVLIAKQDTKVVSILYVLMVSTPNNYVTILHRTFRNVLRAVSCVSFYSTQLTLLNYI